MDGTRWDIVGIHSFRFTYRNEIHIKANDQQEAERIMAMLALPIVH